MVKPIVVYTKAQIETDNILNNDNLKRGSVIYFLLLWLHWVISFYNDVILHFQSFYRLFTSKVML